MQRDRKLHFHQHLRILTAQEEVPTSNSNGKIRISIEYLRWYRVVEDRTLDKSTRWVFIREKHIHIVSLVYFGQQKVVRRYHLLFEYPAFNRSTENISENDCV
jgi:hypothetical protein